MLLLALVALAVPLALSLRDRVDAEVRAQARNQADIVAATAADLLRPARRADLQRLAETASRSVRGRVIVVDRRGVVLADSAGAGQVGDSYAGRPEIAAALRGEGSQVTRRSRTLGEELLATAVPVLRGGRPNGAVRITQSVEAVHRAVRRAIVEVALIAGVVLALGLAAGALLAGQIARPLRRLDRAVRRVAEGDLSARAPVEGSAEQQSLARTFNEMTERVGRLLDSHRDFVADASHQLRTPLTGLRLRLEEARGRAADPEVAAQLDAAMAEVDRLAEMVAELLVLSRAGERDLPGEEVDLAQAARRARDRWRVPAEEAGIDVRANAAAPAPVWCAPSDLDRALDSLVENALRYAPRGTTVQIAARSGGIEVLDQGPGLEEGEEEEVFERFHRGRAGRRGPAGTGLGLPIARELARVWRGTVTLSNRPEGGARAVLELPPREE